MKTLILASFFILFIYALNSCGDDSTNPINNQTPCPPDTSAVILIEPFNDHAFWFTQSDTVNINFIWHYTDHANEYDLNLTWNDSNHTGPDHFFTSNGDTSYTLTLYYNINSPPVEIFWKVRKKYPGITPECLPWSRIFKFVFTHS